MVVSINQAPYNTGAMKPSSRALLVVALLCLSGLYLSGLSLFHHTALHNNVTVSSTLCHISATLNCDAINRSPFSSIFGIPIASYGIFFYLSLLVFLLIAMLPEVISAAVSASVLLALSFFAVIWSILLFLLSKFVIGSLCPLCLAIYGINLLLFLISWWHCGNLGPILTGTQMLVGAPRLLLRGSSQSKLLAWLFSLVILFAAYFSITLSDALLVRILLPNDYETKYKAAVNEAIEFWENDKSVSIPLNLDGSALSDFAKGPASAALQIVEFSDYQCPFCRKFYLELEDFTKQNPERIQLVLRNFPLDRACNAMIPDEMHKHACQAALFSRCAGEQGKFWKASEYLFTLPELEDNSSAGGEAINRGIDKLALDGDAMRECMNSDRQMKKIQSDIKAATKAGLNGTPFILANGKQVKIPSIEVLQKILERVTK